MNKHQRTQKLGFLSEETDIMLDLFENEKFKNNFEIKPDGLGYYNIGSEALEYGLPSFKDEMRYLIKAIDGKQNLWNKTILDLGCGTIHNRQGIEAEGSDYGEYGFEPWLCRLLLYLGIKTIGIDINNLDNEKFEHYQLDLLKPNSLSFLPNNSIDIAHSRWFFNSPTLMKIIYGKVDESNPEKYKRAKEKLMNILNPQLERIVKPEGIFVYG